MDVRIENGAESPNWGATAIMIVGGDHIITTHGNDLNQARGVAERLDKVVKDHDVLVEALQYILGAKSIEAARSLARHALTRANV